MYESLLKWKTFTFVWIWISTRTGIFLLSCTMVLVDGSFSPFEKYDTQLCIMSQHFELKNIKNPGNHYLICFSRRTETWSNKNNNQPLVNSTFSEPSKTRRSDHKKLEVPSHLPHSEFYPTFTPGNNEYRNTPSNSNRISEKIFNRSTWNFYKVLST